MDKVKQQVMATIRTWAPMIVGTVLAWLSRKAGIVVDEQTKVTVVTVFTAVLMGAYYLVVSLLERFVFPKLGAISWLLFDFRKGNTAPIYPDAITATEVPTSGAIAAGAEVTAKNE